MQIRNGYNLTRVKVQQSMAELIDDGYQQSKLVPYSELGYFKVQQRDSQQIMKNIHNMLLPELIPLRNARMAVNEFAFFRGSVELMDHDLVRGYNSGIPAIICGDAHIGNFGFFASPERQLLFDLNDFDEAGINYWEWDLKRLLVSILLAGKNNQFESEKIIKLLRKVSKTYRKGLTAAYDQTALTRFYPKNSVAQMMAFVDDETNKNLLDHIIAKAQNRNSEQVVKKYTTTDTYGQLQFKENPPRSTHPNKAISKRIVKAFGDYRQTVRTDVALLLSQYHITDIIRHSVGVGSFGSLCYLILLTNNDGSHLVLQVKEALPTRKRRNEDHKALTLQIEANEGQRIIDCQKILQSASDPFLGYFQANEKNFYVRQFRDMKESIDLTKLTWPQFKSYVKICALILANAHSQSPRGATILGYVHDGKNFDLAVSQWAQAYSAQVHLDYQQFVKP
ncbi:DUF2252 domain-containing protein [Agrilactobacillus yilanensis]|uniref:DUF2252 domain-containing protein n=1 Tax=Agrilactobacillus yilanensis TaxID=2485997 RepID=A0ABW4J9F8_9LACO|nr:DUF2252 domain-containing protein [Agrilactobacillus yilanensis]